MVDQIFDSQYQAARKALNGGIDGGLNALATMVMSAFEALHRIQFESPWNSPSLHKPH